MEENYKADNESFFSFLLAHNYEVIQLKQELEDYKADVSEEKMQRNISESKKEGKLDNFLMEFDQTLVTI